MKRLALLLASACGPTAQPAHVVVPKPPPPEFACPEALPGKRTDAQAAAAGMAGQSIDHVCVLGGDGETVDAVNAALTTKVGTKLDAARIHDDLLAVLDLPMVDDASAYAARGQGGLVVYFELRERPFIGDVIFEGVHAFNQEELAKVPLATGQRFDVIALRRFAQVFRKAYEERAFGGANVETKATPAASGKVNIVVTVDEGIRWKFGPLTFSGNKTLTKTELTKAAGFAPGDVWSADVLERARAQVQALAYDHGLVQSELKVDRGAPAADGAVPVTFTLHEGDVFRVRKLTVPRVAPSDEKQILAAMKAKPHAVFSRGTIVADIQVVRTKLGWEIDPNVTVDAPAKVVDIAFDAVKK